MAVSIDFLCEAAKALQAAHGNRLLGDWFNAFQTKLSEAEALYKAAPRPSAIAKKTPATNALAEGEIPCS